MKAVNDRIATLLEQKGLWRRAASRWLDVIMYDELSDEQRLWIRCRRIYCLSRLLRKTSDIHFRTDEVLQAARATEARMGISCQYDMFFSRKNKPDRCAMRIPPDTEHFTAEFDFLPDGMDCTEINTGRLSVNDE